jgi:hypothetical protein
MLIDSILHQHPRLDHDLFQMDAQLWAIHGYIPVDGEVILAEFEHHEAARTVLDRLAAAQDVTEMSRTISKAEGARVLRIAGYSAELIREIHDQLPDPIDLDRDRPILSHYGISRELLIDIIMGSR